MKTENEKIKKGEFLLYLENIPLFEDNKITKKRNKKKLDIYYILIIYAFFFLSIKFYFLGLRGCRKKIAEKCHELNNIIPYIKRGIEKLIIVYYLFY
jgi:hypothetical protein